jgi:hypothetical protein
MKRIVILTSILAGLLMGELGSQRVGADEPAQEEDNAALLKLLSTTKHSLADGIRQATTSAEVPISAKFELDDNGKLSCLHRRKRPQY